MLKKIESDLRIAIKNHDYVVVAKLQKKLAEEKRIHEEAISCQLGDLFSQMSPDDSRKISLMIHTMNVLCDLQEKIMVDLNAMTYKQGGWLVTQFDKVLTETKEIRGHLTKKMPHMAQCHYGDVADEAEEWLVEHVRKSLNI